MRVLSHTLCFIRHLVEALLAEKKVRKQKRDAIRAERKEPLVVERAAAMIPEDTKSLLGPDVEEVFNVGIRYEPRKLATYEQDRTCE